MSAPPPPTPGCVVEFADGFAGDTLDERKWLPYYLPQWSSRAQAAARYTVAHGALRLRIDADQPPWCPQLDGDVRVSSLQTGVFSGPLGTAVGQHRFAPAARVTEEQPPQALYTPTHGLIEVRLRALDDPRCMVALWLIGFEDEPERSAEICVREIFGRDVAAHEARVGMGVHPFGDPRITDDFEGVPVTIDVRRPHVYAADWTPDGVVFSIDGGIARTVAQSPRYPMQLMLGIYEFPAGEDADRDPAAERPYPKELVVDWIRVQRAAT